MLLLVAAENTSRNNETDWIVFLNLQVDTYGTVQPHTLIRQHMDYMHWYDRTKLTLKEIHNCQYVSCMNPTAGSFTINPRLQRHFCVFAVRSVHAPRVKGLGTAAIWLPTEKLLPLIHSRRGISLQIASDAQKPSLVTKKGESE